MKTLPKHRPGNRGEINTGTKKKKRIPKWQDSKRPVDNAESGFIDPGFWKEGT